MSQGFATVLRCATFAHRRPPRPMVQDPRSACPAEDPRQKVRAWSWVVHERGSSQAVILAADLGAKGYAWTINDCPYDHTQPH